MNFSSDPVNTLENLIVTNKVKNFSIYLTLIFGLVIFLILLPILKVDISSQSRGIIRSKTDNVPVTTIVNGYVTWLGLKNNISVKKGDTLIKMSMQGLDADKRTQDTLSDSVSLLLKDVNNLLLNKSSRLLTSTAREDFFNFQAHKNELESKIMQAQINYDRNKKLYDKEIIAKVEYEKYDYEFQFAKQALQSYATQQKSAWENQKRDLENRLKTHKGAVAKINAEAVNYIVKAPISGTVENFSGIQAGSFLSASQSVGTISAEDYLIVENNVSPKDIGLIRRSQKVKFQLDAFNYNQWGFLEGKVIDIDHNITIQGEQAFFKVRCSLDSKLLQLKSGYKINVSKGMTLTTRYTITRRSLFDLLFDKVDDWLNPKQMR
ncbi:MAG: HlyD family efflux transporter periplasmic adaptor subunit [Flavobacterium sp.]